jgi:hypothetical protein
MIIRTYIDKDNTLISGSELNVGRNPVTELYYGGIGDQREFTRYIFYFDVNKLKEQYNAGNLGDLSKVTHTFKMTNTSALDLDQIGRNTDDEKVRLSSFDLILFRVNQPWDEGCGCVYVCGGCNGCSSNYVGNNITASNWYYSQGVTNWSVPGVYSGSTSGITLSSQHFDFGNENLCMDITSVVNDLITGTTENYGFGIAFPSNIESLETRSYNYVGFFSKQTQTYFEPFLETKYTGIIEDDRSKFYMDKQNNLCLYVNLGNKPTNLDNLPTVEIYDDNENILQTIPPSGVTQVMEGVYCVNTFISSSGNTDCLTFTDVWKNISINGISRPNAELEFSLINDDSYYNLGTNEYMPVDYSFAVSGIKRDERIKRGDLRKVLVTAKIPYSVSQTDVIDGLYYRLYIREGDAEITIIDWDSVNKAFNHNFFMLDTSWMIPSTYYLDIKLINNREVSILKDVMKFLVINEPEINC